MKAKLASKASLDLCIHDQVLVLDDPQLSESEQQELLHCEEVITRNLGAFFEIGAALLIVNQKRLYRAQHHSFDQYCRERWDMSRMHAYRLLHAAEVHQALSPIGGIPLPANEAQIRPLTALPITEAKKVWKQVVKRAGEKKITAGLVAEVVAKVHKDSPPEKGSRVHLLQWQRDAHELLAGVAAAITQNEFGKALEGLDMVRLRVDIERARASRQDEESAA